MLEDTREIRVRDKNWGANPRYVEFQVSYAIAVGGVGTLAMIGHNNCATVNLVSRKDRFIQGLFESGGWDRSLAQEHFECFAPMFEIGNEVDFLVSEVKRLRLRYPKVDVVPLMYNVEDHLLYLVDEE